MGKRFFVDRYPLANYSSYRAFLRLNEGDFEPHQIRPYGLGSGKFAYNQMFLKKHGSRPGNRAVKRSAKKSARQRAQRELCECSDAD